MHDPGGQQSEVVDACWNDASTFVATIPIEFVLAGAALALGQFPNEAPGHVVHGKLHMIGELQLEREMRIVSEWIRKDPWLEIRERHRIDSRGARQHRERMPTGRRLAWMAFFATAAHRA